MEISPTITSHSIVLVVDKRERAIGMQTLLSKIGYRVILAQSLYDALKFVAQEMPHLVISEAVLSDGTAGILYDRLQQHPTLKHTPIMVCVLKKTKEELGVLAGRKIAGFTVGPLEPKSFVAKVNEVIKTTSSVSPYFVLAEKAGIAPELNLSIDATAVGRSGEQLISRSNIEIDSSASMLCIPTGNNTDLKPAVLRMATNVREGEEIFNLFPVNRIVGVGRKWVLALPEIKIGGNDAPKQDKLYKVIFYDPNEQRYDGFKEIMKGYQIDLIHAKSLLAGSAILKREPESIHAIYLHELMSDASSIEWKNVYNKLPANQKPPLIVGTTSLNARSQGTTRYIKRPFGMGLFVEMLQACFATSTELAGAAGKSGSNSITGIPVRYQAPATLVGLDETGGIIQVKFPLLKGSKIKIEHKFLQSLWEGNQSVSVVSSGATASQPDIWHARFDVIGPGVSKVKYWEKISKLLESMIADVAKQAAAEKAA
jgi:DNA-binding response OmpR family regulator